MANLSARKIREALAVESCPYCGAAHGIAEHEAMLALMFIEEDMHRAQVKAGVIPFRQIVNDGVYEIEDEWENYK